MRKRTAALAAALALAAPACEGPQQEVDSGATGVNAQVGDILMRNVRVEVPPQGAHPPEAEARVWLALLNQGPAPDSLVDVASPWAERVEIRWDRECDSTYDTVAELPLRPTEPAATGLPTTGVPSAVMPPDAYHLRMVELTAPVLAGTTVELTFRFERAGQATVRARVRPPDALRPEPGTRCDRPAPGIGTLSSHGVT